MIDTQGIREVMIDEGLNPYLGVPVILADQINKAPAYPFVVIRFNDFSGEPIGHPARVVVGNVLRTTETVIWTIDFQTEAEDPDVSARLAHQVRDWFRTSRLLQDRFGIGVANVGGIDDRAIALGAEWEYRHGIEIELRVTNTIIQPLEAIEAAKIEEVDPLGN
ncbi:phage neck terminator protein [Saccharibacillus sacchari]|uniref:Uncharacterized protein n=1 Tax=Saccharibacillus sacchari TaxID=456493 RepID=A0ACC6PIB0_9BACL